jgi:hypothetical protein
MTHYKAGAPHHPGTALPNNVTGECPHRHRTPEAAQRCVARADRAIKRGHGTNAYSDRIVIEVADDGRRSVWKDPS